MKKSAITLCLAAFAALLSAAPAAREARIDVYNIGAPENTLAVADKGTAKRADAERWMKTKQGAGALAIFPFKGADWQTDTVTFKAVGSGKLRLTLYAPDVRGKDKKRLKIQVDYKKIVVNGKTIYDAGENIVSVWHDMKPKISAYLPVKDGEILKIEVTSRPTPVK